MKNHPRLDDSFQNQTFKKDEKAKALQVHLFFLDLEATHQVAIRSAVL